MDQQGACGLQSGLGDVSSWFSQPWWSVDVGAGLLVRMLISGDETDHRRPPDREFVALKAPNIVT